MESLKQSEEKKLIRKVQVKNNLGIHTRPATVIAKLLYNSRSDITFTHKRQSVNAKSILSVLMLAARKNSVITITVEGEDAEKTMEGLVQAFETGFGELS